MSENNQQVRWGTVTVVPVDKIPQRATGKYLELYQDICLRLEQTPPSDSVRYPIDDPKALSGAASALKKMFKGKPVHVVRAAGALFVYNTVAPAKRHIGGPRGPRVPRKIGLSDEQGEHPNGNGRRLEGVPGAAEMFEPGPDDDIA